MAQNYLPGHVCWDIAIVIDDKTMRSGRRGPAGGVCGAFGGAIPKARRSESVCFRCEGAGWVEVPSTRPPVFEICPRCCNPEGRPCP